jgi:hypothetical protein
MQIICLHFNMGIIKFPVNSEIGKAYEVIIGLLLNYVKVHKSCQKCQVTNMSPSHQGGSGLIPGRVI